MSKHTYIFEYLVSSPARQVGQKLFKKIRAMNEKEAVQRFNRWSTTGHSGEAFEVSVKRIAKSDDIEWITSQRR